MNTHSDKKRSCRMTKWAEFEAESRRRITECAVELHGTLGSARTTISALAERAGVQGATIYRHFPDEAAIFAACSSRWGARNPPPDLRDWTAVEDSEERLDQALLDLYRCYRRTEGMWTNLLRDEIQVPILSELLADFRQYLEAAREMLLAGRSAEGSTGRQARAALGHALAFSTWRSLAVDQGLDDSEIADLIRGLVSGAEKPFAA